MTSPTSTIPFPVDHMFRMLTLTDGIMNEVAYVPGGISEVAINHGPVAVLGTPSRYICLLEITIPCSAIYEKIRYVSSRFSLPPPGLI